MNILEFVRNYCPALKMSGRTEMQYGVLVFDLGEVGPNPHLPKLKCYIEIQNKVSDNGPSGPWIVQTNSWRPALKLAETEDGHYRTDRHGDYLTQDYGSRETIHTEKWLLGGISGYLGKYYRAFGRMPLSVSLFTLMAPCSECNKYLRSFPGRSHTPIGIKATPSIIGRWHLGYSMNYDREYKTALDGDVATAELSKYGWTILKLAHAG